MTDAEKRQRVDRLRRMAEEVMQPGHPTNLAHGKDGRPDLRRDAWLAEADVIEAELDAAKEDAEAPDHVASHGLDVFRPNVVDQDSWVGDCIRGGKTIWQFEAGGDGAVIAFADAAGQAKYAVYLGNLQTPTHNVVIALSELGPGIPPGQHHSDTESTIRGDGDNHAIVFTNLRGVHPIKCVDRISTGRGKYRIGGSCVGKPAGPHNDVCGILPHSTHGRGDPENRTEDVYLIGRHHNGLISIGEDVENVWIIDCSWPPNVKWRLKLFNSTGNATRRPQRIFTNCIAPDQVLLEDGTSFNDINFIK